MNIWLTRNGVQKVIALTLCGILSAALMIMCSPSFAHADDLIKTASGYDRANHSTDGADGLNNFTAQSFLTIGAGTIASTTQVLDKNTTFTGTFVQYIYAVDGSGHPTGSALGTSDTHNISELTAAAATFIHFTYSSPVSVLAATTYATVLSCLTGCDPVGGTKYMDNYGHIGNTYNDGWFSESATVNSGYTGDNTGDDDYHLITVVASAAAAASSNGLSRAFWWW